MSEIEIHQLETVIDPNVPTNSTNTSSAKHVPFSDCVVILGWAHGDVKQLRKYSELYFKQGYEVIQIVGWVVGESTAPKVSKMTDALRSLQRQYNDMVDLSSNKTSMKKWGYVVHCLSNGGLKILTDFLKTMTTADKNSSIAQLRDSYRGGIYDSCPASHSPTVFARAMTAHMPDGLDKMVRFASVFTKGFIAQMWMEPMGVDINAREGITEISENPIQMTVPHLYMYSRDDKITTYSFVEQQLALHRARLEQALAAKSKKGCRPQPAALLHAEIAQRPDGTVVCKRSAQPDRKAMRGIVHSHDIDDHIPNKRSSTDKVTVHTHSVKPQANDVDKDVLVDLPPPTMTEPTIESICFHGSPHVTHYRDYPVEYRNAVLVFVRNAFYYGQQQQKQSPQTKSSPPKIAAKL